MAEINIKCKGSTEVNIDDLQDVQGEVKFLPSENLQKLLTSLEKNGFCEPFVIWRENQESKPVVIAGNQRLKAIKKARELGWLLPLGFPAVEVEAENLQQAKKILLSLASTFGRVDKHHLEHFITDNELNLDEMTGIINFPELKLDLNLPKIEGAGPAGLENSGQASEGDTTNEGEIRVMKIPFLSEDFDRAMGLLERVFDQLKSEDKVSSHSEVIMLLLQLKLDETEKQ